MAEKKQTTVDAINQLADAIKGLEQKIDHYYNLKPNSVKLDATASTETKTPEEPQTPFPSTWRTIIDEVLSPQFKARVDYRGDGRFELSIFVPKEFSNSRPADWEINQEDKRIKVMDNALGEVGVRDYCQQIASNLGPSIMEAVSKSKSELKGV